MDVDGDIAPPPRRAWSPARPRIAMRPGVSGPNPGRGGDRLRTDRPGGWPVGPAFAPGRRGHALDLFRRGVTEADRAAFGDRPVELALLVRRPLLVLCFRFGHGAAWEALPYAWPLDERPSRAMPRRRDGEPALLRMSLVDADDGIVRARRGVVLDPGFAGALDEAIRHQAAGRFDGDAYVDAIAEVYLDLPSASAIARRATVRTVGLG